MKIDSLLLPFPQDTPVRKGKIGHQILWRVIISSYREMEYSTNIKYPSNEPTDSVSSIDRRGLLCPRRVRGCKAEISFGIREARTNVASRAGVFTRENRGTGRRHGRVARRTAKPPPRRPPGCLISSGHC